MDFSGAVSLLGRSSTDTEVQALMSRLAILRQPEVVLDENDGSVLNAQDWLLNKKLGVELGFEARAHLLGQEIEDPKNEPMLLTQIYFYCERYDVGPYQGSLPAGLVASDSRISARDRLAAYESTRRSYTRDTWELPQFQLIIGYANGGMNIGFVSCQLRPPPMPADYDDAALIPSTPNIMAALGKKLSDPGLRLMFSPLRLEQNLEADDGGLVGRFDKHLGLFLHFRYMEGGRDLALTHVLFYREYEADGARWPGTLPNGLHFDDSPEVVFRKIPAEPIKHYDEEFTGEATWKFPEYTLQVLYSTMRNNILRVQVSAPVVLPIA
ncbi:hypothetical protein EOA85_15140 [Mesorhizobium sp. M5C.F.Ca.IN.020.29.1.1]|uniref:hypothetical protein n=1 Tax=unclassified Mesorhizobium TaxID=325217 RepID=UPI000FCB0884|nr:MULTISPECIES: hypothetical protein [unclassified Mesorhizobium]RUV57796.1 hypothetical protein EOA85_15140 [Mesorhizobium sp. M5C.F.Ca.IN.020.29.1.1]TIM85379.1 MAG: hypothetical protein E5Y50_19010 [Mesorhizobium sp.]